MEMLSLPRFYGRIGNQLFQYAYLRSAAHQLGVQFYCPAWEGDEIFNLRDSAERAPAPSKITTIFGPKAAGFVEHKIVDGTELHGYFQSEKFYPDKALVRSWFRFNNNIISTVNKQYPFTDYVSLSVRLNDDYQKIREWFPLYPLSYYEKALTRIGGHSPVLVLADNHMRAREFFKPLGRHLHFVDDLTPPEQLFLMTKCRANVITNSTFAWWGAWLNTTPNTVVVCPTAWNRPGVPDSIHGILCDDWLKISGTLPLWDNFKVWRLRHPVATANRLLNNV
jgi:hypothetical protein